MNNKLKNCPGCGGDALATQVFRKGEHGNAFGIKITCKKCLATSGICATEEEAERLWNCRNGERNNGQDADR